MSWYTEIDSPVGRLVAVADADGALVALGNGAPPPDARADEGPFVAAREQLARYFRRDPTPFDLPLAPEGTAFQKRVWAALREIPFGHTRTYGWLAATLGDSKLTRAVGRANGANPIAIVVPCHRVIGGDGGLVGYAGGLPMKRALLVNEGVLLI